MVMLVVLVDEEFEIGEFFGGQDEGFGVDAGFQGVHRGGGLAGDRGRAGGFLGVAAVGFYLSQSGHIGGSERTGREACPTLRIEGRFE